MNQNFEIEFKNVLSESDYREIYAKVFENSSDMKHIIFQTNYYFDTIDKALKKQGSVLRIRVTDSFNELTFKVPSRDFLLETNYHLSDNDVSEIILAKKFRLSSSLSPKDSIPELENISKDTILYLFNQFKTKRLEKQMGEHLIVLDQTTFQNGVVDYELEIESTDAKSGREFYETFLKDHAIPKATSLPKIARAEKNRHPFS